MSERNSDDPGQRDRSEGEGNAPAVRWDETNARTISPTICTISATPKEFVFLFGKEESPRPDGQERTVYDAERIVLNPSLVKPLAASLNEVLRQYESRFGRVEPARSDRGRRRPRADFPDFLAPMSEAPPDKGRALFDLVTTLDAEIAHEHSFKVSRGRLSENRFLLAVSRADRENALDEKVKQVCVELGMPDSFLETFARGLPDANHVYFGFEEDGARSLYKAYLELRDRAEERIREGAPPETLLLHLGFKWDVSDRNRKAVARYEWHHSLDFREILQRLPAMLPRRPGHDTLSVAEAIIGLASDRVEPRDVQYVEVREEGNSRKSFDINLYKSGVRLEELKPFLLSLADCYDLDRQEFAIFCDQVAWKRFGHLAGGTDREGRDFITVYYGVEYLT